MENLPYVKIEKFSMEKDYLFNTGSKERSNI